MERMERTFNRLTAEVKRFNDAREGVKATIRSEAEVFRANYDRESEERREGKEYLRGLEAMDQARSSSARQKGRSKEEARADR